MDYASERKQAAENTTMRRLSQHVCYVAMMTEPLNRALCMRNVASGCLV